MTIVWPKEMRNARSVASPGSFRGRKWSSGQPLAAAEAHQSGDFPQPGGSDAGPRHSVGPDTDTRAQPRAAESCGTIASASFRALGALANEYLIPLQSNTTTSRPLSLVPVTTTPPPSNLVVWSEWRPRRASSGDRAVIGDRCSARESPRSRRRTIAARSLPVAGDDVEDAVEDEDAARVDATVRVESPVQAVSTPRSA